MLEVERYSIGIGERLLPRSDFTLCQQFTLIGSGMIWNIYFGVVEAAHAKGASVKVIFETAFLNDEQIIKACELTEKAGADYVKTSTGFASAGANAHVVSLMAKTVPGLGVKASGGVRTLDQLIDMVEAGATRVGASGTLSILEEFDSKI